MDGITIRNCGRRLGMVGVLALLVVELVNQKYRDFPTTDIRNGGRFKGFMVEGVVAF